jgi:hypothetical protein
MSRVFRSPAFRVARGISVRFTLSLAPPSMNAEWNGDIGRLPSRPRRRALARYREGRTRFLAAVAAEVGDVLVLETTAQHAAEILLEMATPAGHA